MKTPTFLLPSPETGTEYHIYVEGPHATDGPGPWPVMLFMDGDDQFSYAVAAYRELRKAERIQPLLLVGVGYGASYSKPANQRGRDYTPTANAEEPSSGGAAAFFSFITRTLWRELSVRYPVSEIARGIGGHSLGSLLALYALAIEPLFFTHYLVSAPSIWWDNRSILKLLAKRHARNATLRAHVFLCVGEKDSQSMTGDLTLLEQQLTAQPFVGLDLTTRHFANRTHHTAMPDGFNSGLTTLWGVAKE